MTFSCMYTIYFKHTHPISPSLHIFHLLFTCLPKEHVCCMCKRECAYLSFRVWLISLLKMISGYIRSSCKWCDFILYG